MKFNTSSKTYMTGVITFSCLLFAGSLLAQQATETKEKKIVKKVVKVEVDEEVEVNDDGTNIFVTTNKTEDGSNVSKTIKITEENGVKTMVVTTITDGKKVVETFEGDEVDKYMESQDDVHVLHGDNNFVMITGEGAEVISLEDCEKGASWSYKTGDHAAGEEKIIVRKMSTSEEIDAEDVDVEVKDDKVIVRVGEGASATEKVIYLNEASGENGEEVDIDVKVIKDGDAVMKEVIVVKRIVMLESLTDEELAKARLTPKKELELDAIELYPNPNDGRFTIDFETKGKGKVDVTIHDLNGREIFRDSAAGNGRYTQQIDISAQPKGVYILNLRQGKKSTSKKLVLE